MGLVSITMKRLPFVMKRTAERVGLRDFPRLCVARRIGFIPASRLPEPYTIQIAQRATVCARIRTPRWLSS
jgi:hypothetical protein